MAEEEKKTESNFDTLGLTPDEIKFLESEENLGGNIPEKLHNVHTFLHNVAVSDDTTKLGNLNEIELGNPQLPLRTYKELALFSQEVANMGYFKEYFDKMGEVTTSTSLSKEAKLLELAVVTRREIADVSKRKVVQNKGWFGKKEKEEKE